MRYIDQPFKITNVTIIDTGILYYVYFNNHTESREINIYEFANKCKQFAYDKDFTVNSHIVNHGKAISTIDEFDDCSFIGDNEPDCIINACTWLLNYPINNYPISTQYNG